MCDERRSKYIPKCCIYSRVRKSNNGNEKGNFLETKDKEPARKATKTPFCRIQQDNAKAKLLAQILLAKKEFANGEYTKYSEISSSPKTKYGL